MLTARSVIFAFVLLSAPGMAAELVPRYSRLLEGPAGYGFNHLAADRAGNIYAISTANGDVVVTKLTASGDVAFTTRFGGSGADRPAAIAVDAEGNSYIAGVTGSSDFPLRDPYLSEGDMFLVKLDAAGRRLVYSTLLGKGKPRAIAVDGAGNVYLTGQAASPDFQATPGAYQTTSVGRDAFVLKMNAAGNRPHYATFIGGHGPACDFPTPHCPFPFQPLFPPPYYFDEDEGTAIAIDSDGNAYLGGITNAADFPVTAGAFQQRYLDPRGTAFHGFVAKLNAGGSALVYSTYLGTTLGVRILALAIDRNRNAYAAGNCYSADFPTASGALQATAEGDGGLLVKLAADGGSLAYATYLGNRGQVAAIDVGDDGTVTATGYGTSFPALGGPITAFGRLQSFVVQVNATGAGAPAGAMLPYDVAGLSLARSGSGEVAVTGSSNILTSFALTAKKQPALYGLKNAAASILARAVSPGELITLYGAGLGPPAGALGELGQDGALVSEIAGVRVLIDGQAAPLLYVQENQINAIVPYEVAGKRSSTVQAVLPEVSTSVLEFPILDVTPEIFTGEIGQAAALNEDGTLNSIERDGRAKPGSVVTVFGTAAGLLEPPAQTGVITTADPGRPKLPVSLQIQYSNQEIVDAEILYAGAAPGVVSGVIQVDFRLPLRILAPLQGIALKVGDQRGQRVTLWTTP